MINEYVIFIFISIAGCRKTPTAPSSTPISLKINAQAFVAFSGSKLKLSAVVAFQDGSEKDVTSQAVWSNQPETAGRVDEGGEFTAFTGQVGVESVRAEFQGQVAIASIVVSRRAVIFSIIPAFTNLQSGESIKMKGVGQFEDNTVEFVSENITWSISPGVAAQIDESGRLRSIAGMVIVRTRRDRPGGLPVRPLSSANG